MFQLSNFGRGHIERVCLQGDVMDNVGLSKAYCRLPRDDRVEKKEKEFDKTRFFDIEIPTTDFVFFEEIESFGKGLLSKTQMDKKLSDLYLSKEELDVEEVGIGDLGQLDGEDAKEFHVDQSSIDRDQSRAGPAQKEREGQGGSMNAPHATEMPTKKRSARSEAKKSESENSGDQSKKKKKKKKGKGKKQKYTFGQHGRR